MTGTTGSSVTLCRTDPEDAPLNDGFAAAAAGLAVSLELTAAVGSAVMASLSVTTGSPDTAGWVMAAVLAVVTGRTAFGVVSEDL